jgi:hypothetical protein
MTETRIRYLPGKDVDPKDAIRIWQEIIRAGKEEFAGTTVLVPGAIGEEEVTAAREFLKKAAEINPAILNQSTQEHIALAALYARLMGEVLCVQSEEKNIFELELLGLLHDLGRTFNHRKGRNELLAARLAERIGIREELVAKLPPDSIFIPDRAVAAVRAFRNLPEGVLWTSHEPTRVLIEEVNRQIADINRVVGRDEDMGYVLAADMLGKFNGDRLRRWQDLYSTAHVGVKKEYQVPHIFPSEAMRMLATNLPGHREATNNLYRNLGEWLEGRLGVNLDQLVELAESRLVI